MNVGREEERGTGRAVFLRRDRVGGTRKGGKGVAIAMREEKRKIRQTSLIYGRREVAFIHSRAEMDK